LSQRYKNLHFDHGAVPRRIQRPYWFPAASYYTVSAIGAGAALLVVWGILHDAGEDFAWVYAAIAATIIFVTAIVLREVFLRRARSRYLVIERKFEQNMSDVYSRVDRSPGSKKLTIEKNSTILSEIKKKSDAAIVLGKYPEGHREVFEMCGEYIALVDREFERIGSGSPRIGPLRKGREAVREFHKYHLLQWASIQTKNLISEANGHEDMSTRIASAQNAMDIVDSALAFYPTEPTLIGSREVVSELLASIKVSNWIELAERAEFDGNIQQAKHYYRDALFYLSREDGNEEERSRVADRISEKIERLGRLD